MSWSSRDHPTKKVHHHIHTKLGTLSASAAPENLTNHTNTKPEHLHVHNEAYREYDTERASDNPTPSSDSGDDDVDLDERYQSLWERVLNRLSTVEAKNLPFNPVEPGIWDDWGVYYCSSRFGHHSKFNPTYFALAAILVIGQSNFFDLIHHMHAHGGAAFLVALFLVYISFGYPMYMLLTLMGQYSGRKPVEMIYLLMPACAGVGIGLYIRTLISTVGAMAHFCFAICICWDSLFCEGALGIFLKKIALHESHYKRFELFSGLAHPYFSSDQFPLDKFIIFGISLIYLMCLKRLDFLGKGIKVVLRLLFILLFAYSYSVHVRTRPVILDGTRVILPGNSMLFLPLQLTLKPNWSKLFDGKVWVAATALVMQSLELGTLIHPYLGSKQFFHYRCTRDGFLLIAVSFSWNIIGAIGVLLWTGYIGISKEEIKSSFHELHGHYGFFVVFMMKHLQAELTQHVEADIMFFITLFYGITGIASLLASLVHMYILIDCSYSECGHPLMKLCIMFFYTSFLCFFVFPLFTSEGAIQHMTALEFYGLDDWVGLFLLTCFASAVAWSQGVGRVLYDLFNMIHLTGYELRTHYYQGPKIFAFLYIGYLIFAMLSLAVSKSTLHEGPMDWSDPVTSFFGTILLVSPALAVFIGAIIFLVTNKNESPALVPHRDFYKNKYHVSVCFKDYQDFLPKKKPSESKRRSSVRFNK